MKTDPRGPAPPHPNQSAAPGSRSARTHPASWAWRSHTPSPPFPEGQRGRASGMVGEPPGSVQMSQGFAKGTVCGKRRAEEGAPRSHSQQRRAALQAASPRPHGAATSRQALRRHGQAQRGVALLRVGAPCGARAPGQERGGGHHTRRARHAASPFACRQGFRQARVRGPLHVHSGNSGSPPRWPSEETRGDMRGAARPARLATRGPARASGAVDAAGPDSDGAAGRAGHPSGPCRAAP